VFLALIILCSYVTGQISQDLNEATVNLISTIIRNAAEVFNRD